MREQPEIVKFVIDEVLESETNVGIVRIWRFDENACVRWMSLESSRWNEFNCGRRGKIDCNWEEVFLSIWINVNERRCGKSKRENEEKNVSIWPGVALFDNFKE